MDLVAWIKYYLIWQIYSNAQVYLVILRAISDNIKWTIQTYLRMQKVKHLLQCIYDRQHAVYWKYIILHYNNT